MNIQDIIYLNTAELYMNYNCDTHMYNLCVNINGYKLSLFTTINLNYQLNNSELGYMVEVVKYFKYHATPISDISDLDICELQEKFCVYPLQLI